MAKKKKKELKFEIKNLGPHNNINYSLNFNKLKIACFAKNGMGKTFISRTFQLDEADYENHNFLSFGETKGLFKFSIDDAIYNVTFNNNNPIIENSSNFIFHVFNSDFVSSNLERKDYCLDNQIEGYIIGEDFIDLRNDKEKLKNLEKKLETLKDNLSNSLNKIKDKLTNNFSVNKLLKEYTKLSLENLDENILNSENENNLNKILLKLIGNYNTVSSMPDDINDVIIHNFNLTYDIFNDIDKILSNSYSKFNLNDDLTSFCKQNNDFVTRGIELLNNSNCPFCKQDIPKNSEIIKKYKCYLKDEESKVIKKINLYKDKISNFKNDFYNYYQKCLKSKETFENIKKYLPDFEEELIIPNIKKLDSYLDCLLKILDDKISDVSKNLSLNSKKILNKIQEFIKKTNDENTNNKNNIALINNSKNDIKNRKTTIQRELCTVNFKIFHFNEKQTLMDLSKTQNEINVLKKSIKDKQKKFRRSKKEAVASSFEYFLKFFFEDKYSFDTENFVIKFGDNISSSISKVLSDGEKSIVAFCYYLASTHLAIQNKSDYQRLCFIIDDPISSIDFNYIYALVTSIKQIKTHFIINKELRFLILTHNSDFMNMLIKNKITETNIYLTKNSMQEFKEIPLPYEAHLNDIIDVFKNKANPSHTTPNSLRHILENIMYFEKNYNNLLDFVRTDETLKTDPSLYHLVQDLSHGGNNAILPDVEIKRSCYTVLKYIQKHYAGQLKDKGVNI